VEQKLTNKEIAFHHDEQLFQLNASCTYVMQRIETDWDSVDRKPFETTSVCGHNGSTQTIVQRRELVPACTIDLEVLQRGGGEGINCVKCPLAREGCWSNRDREGGKTSEEVVALA
jgi:hypothetical protein